jgi:hypothetical protein
MEMSLHSVAGNGIQQLARRMKGVKHSGRSKLTRCSIRQTGMRAALHSQVAGGSLQRGERTLKGRGPRRRLRMPPEIIRRSNFQNVWHERCA